MAQIKDEVTTVEIQGKVFTLKPNYPANVKPVEAYILEVMNACNEAERIVSEFAEHVEKGEASEDVTLDVLLKDVEIDDPLTQRIKIFKMITEGPHDEIDFEYVSTTLLEKVKDHFLPSWMRSAPMHSTYSE